MLWLYLYFPRLQLEQLIDNDGQPSQQAVAVVDAKHNEIVQLNEPAKLAGLRCGMGLATASAMCHSLQVIPYQASLEVRQLEYIAEQLYDFVADIALDQPNGLFLRVGNMLKLYKDIETLWQKISQSLDVHCHYATAMAPLTAKLLARAKVGKITTDELVINQLLSSLSIEQLFPQPKDRTRLKRLGIKTHAQLNRLPVKELVTRFDQAFMHYWGQVSGRLPLKLSFYRPQLKFYQYVELLYEIKEVAIITRPLAKLIMRLCNFLTLRNLATQSLVLTLVQRDSNPLRVNVRSAVPEDNHHKWLALINLHLERQSLTAPVTALAVEVERFVEKKSRIYDFFEQKMSGQLEAEELAGLLVAKLGQDKVFRPCMVSDHRPEHASQLVTTDVKPVSDDLSTALLRPSYLLTKPQPLTEKVFITQGPERIESGWWQQPIVRDYYLGYNNQGQWCWLFRQQDSRWFIHGYFA